MKPLARYASLLIAIWMIGSEILAVAPAESISRTVHKRHRHSPPHAINTHLRVNYSGLCAAGLCIKAHDYKSAFLQFKQMAENGCPYSQCILGLMYRKGIGVKKDAVRSVLWFKLSAEQGFADAERWLGMSYLEGTGIKKDSAKARIWLRRAALHGVAEAQYHLGILYRNNYGPELVQQGEEWLKKAAKQGITEAELAVNEIPPIPNYRGKKDAYSGGLTTITKSWEGYVDIVKELDALDESANNLELKEKLF